LPCVVAKTDEGRARKQGLNKKEEKKQIDSYSQGSRRKKKIRTEMHLIPPSRRGGEDAKVTAEKTREGNDNVA